MCGFGFGHSSADKLLGASVSQYLFKLVGGTIEEVPQIYKDRSPIHHAQKITSPILVHFRAWFLWLSSRTVEGTQRVCMTWYRFCKEKKTMLYLETRRKCL